MTFWDFLCEFIEKGGLAWTLLVIALGGVFGLLPSASSKRVECSNYNVDCGNSSQEKKERL